MYFSVIDSDIKLTAGVLDMNMPLQKRQEEQEFVSRTGQGDIEFVRKAVQSNPQAVSWTDDDGNTGLMQAARNGHAGTVEFLLENKAEINAQNKMKETALILVTQDFARGQSEPR